MAPQGRLGVDSEQCTERMVANGRSGEAIGGNQNEKTISCGITGDCLAPRASAEKSRAETKRW